MDLLLKSVVLFCISGCCFAQNDHLNRQKFNDQLLKDAEHLQEHMKGRANIDYSNMNKKEMHWHYFKEHDLNNDGLLDGLELLKAISHHHGEYDGKQAELPESLPYLERKRRIQEWQDQQLQQTSYLVDELLEQEDKNKDGYLSYLEFRTAREK